MREQAHRSYVVAGPTWVDRFVARPGRVEHLPYGDESNPWYRKWAAADKQPRDRWPWRIRLEIWWFDRTITVGLLYWNVHHGPAPIEPGFGAHFYITSKGWIEGLAV